MPCGTIHGVCDFDAAAVADTMKDALAGFGTDEDQVISTISLLNNEQRQEVASAYKQSQGKDLIDDLKSELRGDFEEVIVAAMTPPRMYDAHQLHDAISGAGTDESQIVEIMCTRSNEELEEIKALYKEEYDCELEEDLCGETSGYFQRMLVCLCNSGREDNEDVDDEKAKEDATRFHEAGEGVWGTEEAELQRVLCLRSPAQLKATITEYEDMHGCTMEDSIRGECSGTLQNGYLAIVESVKDMPTYFARRLQDSMAGLGTSDSDLIRVIVSRSEIDMEDIKERFEAMYEKPLAEAVESECGGDYKKMLLNLLSPQY